jgi:tetratricopeptide (TPR) repeat protein
LLVSAVAPLGQLIAGPIEDAQALLDEKKYDEVDRALQPILSGPAPTKEALLLSLSAAESAGRFVTAQTRATSLLEVVGDKDLPILFRCAKAAALAGESKLATSRYLSYVRQQKEKTPELKQALLGLLKAGDYPNEYKQLIQTFGADEAAYTIGVGLLSRLRQARRGKEATEIAELLLTHYKRVGQVDAVFAQLRAGADRSELGRNSESRFIRPLFAMIKAKPSSVEHPVRFLGQGWHQIPAVQRAKFAFAIHKMAPKKPLLAANSDLFNGLLEMKMLSGPELAKAGKDFLAMEPIYKAATNRDEYRLYVQILSELSTVFGKAAPPLVTLQTLETRLTDLTSRYGGSANALDKIIQNASGRYIKDDAARKAFLTKWAAKCSPNMGTVKSLISKLSPAEAKAFVTSYTQARSFKDGLDLRIGLLKQFNAAKDKAMVTATIKDYFACYAGTYSLEVMDSQFLRTPVLSDDEKVAILQEVVTKAGYSKPLVQLFSRANKAFRRNKAILGKLAPMQKKLEKKAKGGDPAMSTAAQLASLRKNTRNPDAKVEALVKSFLSGYQGQVPGGFEKTKTVPELQAMGIFQAHMAHVQDSRDAVSRCIALWAPKLTDGSAWYSLTYLAQRQRDYRSLATLAPMYFKLVGEGKGDSRVFGKLSYAQGARGESGSVFSGNYAKVGHRAGLNYLAHNRDIWPRSTLFAQVLEASAAPGAFSDWGQFAGFVGELVNRTSTRDKAPVEMIQKLWEHYTKTRLAQGAYSPWFEGRILSLYSRSGHTAEVSTWLKAYQPLVQKRSPIEQASAISGLIDGMADENRGADLVPGMRMHTLLKIFAPLYGGLAPELRRLVPLSNGVTYATSRYLSEWKGKEDSAVALILQGQVAEAIADGARVSGSANYYLPFLASAIGKAAEGKQFEQAVKLVNGLAKVIGRDKDWNRNVRSVITPAVEALRKAGAGEIAFLLSDQVLKLHKVPGIQAKQIALLRTADAKSLPMMLAVGPDDPTYDLHLAASELSRNNEKLAWELTKPKIEMIAGSWEKLNPDYLAWTIDQLRKTAEEQNLQKGLELCQHMLLEEGRMEPETTAAISLLKGDIYRDQENYQASRIEYESLMNNKGLSKTKAGAHAKFRLIANYILTQDYDKAEDLLQRYEDDNKTEVRAEVAYLRGRMSFQREEYTEASKALKTVLEIDAAHVEATLLLGEVNLKLQRLDNTDIEIGPREDRFTVVPGKALTLSLLDPGKNVAQTASAIPIILKTSKGGDVEHMTLRPKQSNRSLFSGVVMTGIGKVKRENHKLELRGDEKVLYQIAPEFQKRMELNYPEKHLEVKSNGKLQASSGRILTEEEQELLLREKALAERQGQQGGEAGSRRLEVRSSTTVRPGSPIYVQVIDMDRDWGDDKDTLPVDVETESGDVLKGFKLTETGIHTGIFRGEIPTGLPFPRASATDAQEGKGANGLISLSNPGSWFSVEDGKKPKWVEVDTMTSHEVSSASLTVKDAKIIKQIHLEGMLVENYERIASFPEDGLAGAQIRRRECVAIS